MEDEKRNKIQGREYKNAKDATERECQFKDY